MFWCCFKSDTNEPFLKNPHSDFETNADTTRASDDIGSSLVDSKPSWMKDEDATGCYSCNQKFNNILIDRKHHCRRCGNIFCHACSNKESKVFLLSIYDSVRVCDKCFHELPIENLYISQHKKFLQSGENFKKVSYMGLSNKIVTLRLMMNEKTLIYNDLKYSETITTSTNTKILLSDIIRIDTVSLKSFEIVTVSNTFKFEAENSLTCKAWIDALKIAFQRAKQPSLREKVENDRRLKLEEERRDEFLNEKESFVRKIKEEKFNKLKNLKEKYGYRNNSS
jgi:hypothetical protein